MIELPQARTQGEIRAVLLKGDGETVVYDSGWFPNLIVNEGLVNMFESSGWASNFNVGSSAQQVMHGDTQLYGWLADAFSAGIISDPGVGPNWQFSTTNKARFLAGVATGTLREVGMNPNPLTDNTDMSIRALLNPEIVKEPDQILDLYYKLTRWPDIVDRVGTTVIDGAEYNYIVRGANYGDGSQPGSFGFVNAFGHISLHGSISAHRAMTGDITTIDSEPVGQTTNPWATGKTLVNSGSGFADYQLTWNLDAALGNIRSFIIREGGHGTSCQRGWQIRLGKVSDDSPLTKNNTKEMILNFRVTGDRL